MASQSQSSNVWLPSLVLLGLAATSYLVHETAYHTSRPVESKTRSQELANPDDVEARLWQDPLYAIDLHLKGEEGSKDKRQAAGHHLPGQLQDRVLEHLKNRPAPPNDQGQQNAANKKPGKSGSAVENHLSDPDFPVLVVMVPGAPYAEPAERRRRIRYAVLSGLNRSGLVSEDQEHIFFFKHDAKSKEPPTYVAYEFLQRAGNPRAADKASERAGSPRSDERAETSGDKTKPPSAALLLWIPTEASHRCPLSHIASILTEIAPAEQRYRKRLRFAVLGPPDSGTLVEMVRESIRPDQCDGKAVYTAQKPWRPSIPMEIYSPWASAANKELAYLLQDDLRSDKPLPDELKACVADPRDPSSPTQDCEMEKILQRHVPFVRLIADDSLLSNALLDELELRGVDPACAVRYETDAADCFGGGLNRHRIAIVSEWDSPYQRALRITLLRTLNERCQRRYHDDPGCDRLDPTKSQDWLSRFSYLRGIDGQTADTPEGQAKTGSDGKPKANDPAHPLGEVETLERADGNTQFDYVRRLAERIERQDRELQSAGKSGIGAIGVLGTDPYDKLTILQALHERFSDKIFFTTNLDARLTHPQEAKWARNLVVVSGFDLELNQNLQRDIPPLRDGYQTAAFFATQFAMRDGNFHQNLLKVRRVRCKAMKAYGLPCDNLNDPPDARSWFLPLVFEIGRTHAIRLPLPVEPTAAKSRTCPEKYDFTCIEVQPAVGPLHASIPADLPALSALAVALVIGLGGLLLVHAAKPKRIESSKQAYLVVRTQVGLVIVFSLLGAAVTLYWNSLMAALTEGGMGEPAVLFEGVSIWPAQVVRLLLVGLGVAFLLRSHRRLRTNREDIMRDFALPNVDEGTTENSLADQESASLGTRIAAHIKDRFIAIRDCMREIFDVKPAFDAHDIESLWRFYLRDGRACARLCRVFCFGVVFTALSWCAFLIWPDFVRFRGARSYEINRAIFVCSVVTFNFLLFYVIDALIICTRCVKRFASGLDWPPASYAKFQDKLGNHTPLKDWMMLQLIAQRTDAVGSLVYMPFFLLFLIIIARNSVFERWGLTPSVVALLTVSVVLIVFAAVRLRMTTEAVRSNALKSLTDQLIVAKGEGDDKHTHQLEFMIEEVRNLRKGAFAPYTEQKFIRALLLPLAGYASSALIEYLSLVKP